MTAAVKLLLVSSWAPPSLGGPQNLQALFSRLPAASYAIVTCLHKLDATPDCAGAWLPCNYYFHDGPALAGGDIPRRGPELLAAHAPRVSRFAQQQALVDHALLGPATRTAMLLRDTVALTRATVSAARAERPTMLLGLSDRGPALLATVMASRLLGIPYALYFFDLYRDYGPEFPYGAVAALTEERLCRGARTLIVTNSPTKDWYEGRYPALRGRVGVVHNAPVSAAAYAAVRTAYSPQAPFRIVFTGKVYWAQERSLLNVIEAMDLLRDRPVRLELYVVGENAAVRAAASQRANVTVTAASQTDMPAVQTGADVLVLPLSWHTVSPSIIATATPGKLAEYLAAGRPILVHAPPTSLVARYARDRGFGEVVDREDPTLIRDAIVRLISDWQHAQGLVTAALHTFAENHDPERNAATLSALLHAAAGEPA